MGANCKTNRQIWHKSRRRNRGLDNTHEAPPSLWESGASPSSTVRLRTARPRNLRGLRAAQDLVAVVLDLGAAAQALQPLRPRLLAQLHARRHADLLLLGVEARLVGGGAGRGAHDEQPALGLHHAA